MKRYLYFLNFLLIVHFNLSAQNSRLKDNNAIGWYTYTGTFKLNNRLSIHSEYQWRRDDVITSWQQSLLRTGINYLINPKLTVRLGYANIETYNYGDIPINGFGKQFTEHRLYQMATLTDKINIADISHRFMLEQRWIGRYSNLNLTKEDDWIFVNRLRYMFRVQIPFKGKSIVNKTPYFSFYDEVFIGFGKNVNENVFDQNRLGILIGYKFSQVIKIEFGYLNQVLQLGREVNGRNVFQYNNGIILNSIFNFDLTKKTSNK